jgi:redox-sensitive bicupin YhaK (pirin superfamily)
MSLIASSLTSGACDHGKMGSMIDVRRASTRFVTVEPGRTTYHSFSFGPHYDPANTGFGALLCHNDDHVQPGHGYDEHPHANLEIVTWVLDGALTHRDSSGNTSVVGVGEVQVLSAGSGVRHSETADVGAGEARFVQAWVRPDQPDTAPAYRSEAVTVGDGFTQVVGPESVPIGTAGASLAVARVEPGDSLRLPPQHLGHLFVARGQLAVGLQLLIEADAARLNRSPELELTCLEPAELMLWSFSPPAG